MQTLPDCSVQRPASLTAAVEWLAREPGARLVAGGTDLLPNLRRGLGRPAMLVDLSAVHGFASVELHPDGALTIGAGITLAALARDALVAQRLPVLAVAAEAVAAPGHRSAATLGGNLCQDTRCVFYNQGEWWRTSNDYCLKLGGTRCHVAPQGEHCHAAFCGDVAPALLVLQAEAEVVSQGGARRLPLAGLYRDDGAAHLALGAGELLARVRIPERAAALHCRFDKARVRGSVEFPLAAAAVALMLESGRVSELRIALSGTNSTPLLLQGTEVLLGRVVDDALVQDAGRLVRKQVSPMRSSATPADYRRQVATVLVQRALRDLAQPDAAAG